MPLNLDLLLRAPRVAMLSGRELGGFVRLLNAAWHQPEVGTLPLDLEFLREVSGLEGDALQMSLTAFGSTEGEEVRCPWMVEIFSGLLATRAKRQEAGGKGGRPIAGTIPLKVEKKGGPSKAKVIGKPVNGEIMSKFNQFWLAYPNRSGKKAAEKSFERALKEVSLETLLAAIERVKRSPNWTREGGKFIPYPATWLNQGRWADEGLVRSALSAPANTDFPAGFREWEAQSEFAHLASSSWASTREYVKAEWRKTLQP